MGEPFFERFSIDETVAGDWDWGLHRGRERPSGRSVLIATTYRHLTPFDELVGQFDRARGDGVIELCQTVIEGRPVDVLVEEVPDGTPSTTHHLSIVESKTLLDAASSEIDRRHGQGFAFGSLRPELIFVDEAKRFTGVAPFSELFFKDIAPGSTAHTYPFEDIYMAPEIVRTESWGPAADVFSLGASYVAWRLGRYPVAGERFLDRLRSLVTGQMIDDVQHLELPTSIRRALSPDPNERPSLTQLSS